MELSWKYITVFRISPSSLRKNTEMLLAEKQYSSEVRGSLTSVGSYEPLHKQCEFTDKVEDV